MTAAQDLVIVGRCASALGSSSSLAFTFLLLIVRLEVLWNPRSLSYFFPVFYVLLAVDVVALCAAVAFLVVDWRRAARAHDWRVDTAEDYRRAA